jgi:tetratricopeptide (TPR) repeat protein
MSDVCCLQRHRFRPAFWLAVMALIVPCGCRKQPTVSSSSLKASLADLRTALQAGRFDRVEALSQQFSAGDPDAAAVAELAGEAAMKAGRIHDALRHYRFLAQRQQQTGHLPLGLFYAAEACRNAAWLAEAEPLYRQFLAVAPQHTLSHERLAFLMSVSGRRWESIPHYFGLVQSGTASVEELVLFADLDRPVEQRPYLEACALRMPDDPLIRLGLAAHAVWEGKTDEGWSRLQAIIAVAPDSVAAQALLGELVVDRSDEEFLAWHRQLPPAADDDPDIWNLRGLWARKRSQPEVAVTCFGEAIRRAPTHRRAMFQLGQLLRQLNHPAAAMVESRSRQLIELTQHIDRVLRTKSTNEASFRDVTLLLEQMGRWWEAAAWGLAAQEHFPDAGWPAEVFQRMSGRLNAQLPLVIESENLGLRLHFSQFPTWESLLKISSHTAQSRTEQSSEKVIRFEESSFGPEFVYHNGSDPDTPGARMFEQTGGGVAVVDYDGDRWPDLFFPQGGVWLSGKTEPDPPGEFTDRLFRNVAGGASEDVTSLAQLSDRGFGQGAAAGDYDNDGFPDLYVASVGRNQLLHNNGDGTFTDVTDNSGLEAADWTTSVAVVDLNDDGLPDLYDVNYVTGPRVYEIICDGKGCSPGAFAGAPDRVWINRGDGTFQLSPPDRPEIDGKGLGVVAFDLDERRRPSLFIANDQVPNFLLRNRTASRQFPVRLEEEGFISGVAFNQDGLAMASMGVAAEDADGDGRLDFYVTTFKDESSLLLLQDADGLFVDRAASAGFRSATWQYVGWGTQFLDADCDGEPDLVAVNGHVDDYRDRGGEYHMRPQAFHNLGRGRFSELSAAEAGPFFAQKRLGRGLSRLDWNRDGKPDFAVSNIGDRASLVLNTSPQVGHAVTIRLVARQTSRDAIGAEVDIQANDRKWRKQLVAGDGYMASNERVLSFGVGAATEVGPIVVHWPSGATSTVQRLPVDGTLDLVEQATVGVFRPTTAEPLSVVVSVGWEE